MLLEASVVGNLKDIEELLAEGADINGIVEGDDTALSRADVNMRVWSGDPDGEWRTALKMARKGGHNSVVQLLISAGARE